jgi:hypothetical protein
MRGMLSTLRCALTGKDRGEGPVGNLMVMTVLGALGAAAVPLMSSVAGTWSSVVGGVISAVGGLFG